MVSIYQINNSLPSVVRGVSVSSLLQQHIGYIWAVAPMPLQDDKNKEQWSSS
jgi:hypothetical protein